MGLSVRASRPTTWSSHSFVHFINTNFDAALSGFGFLSRSNPTDPFVACQWCECFPKRIRQTIGYDCFLGIIWKLVHNTRKGSLENRLSQVEFRLPLRTATEDPRRG